MPKVNVPCVDQVYYYVSTMPGRKHPCLIEAHPPEGKTFDYHTVVATFKTQEAGDAFMDWLEAVGDMLPTFPESILLEAHLRKNKEKE